MSDRLVLVLHLTVCETGESFLDQSQSKVIKKKSIDAQLEISTFVNVSFVCNILTLFLRTPSIMIPRFGAA